MGKRAVSAHHSSFPLLKINIRADVLFFPHGSLPRAACERFRCRMSLNMVRLDVVACEYNKERMSASLGEKAPERDLSACSCRCCRVMEIRTTCHNSLTKRWRLEVHTYLSTSLAILTTSCPTS